MTAIATKLTTFDNAIQLTINQTNTVGDYCFWSTLYGSATTMCTASDNEISRRNETCKQLPQTVNISHVTSRRKNMQNIKVSSERSKLSKLHAAVRLHYVVSLATGTSSNNKRLNLHITGYQIRKLTLIFVQQNVHVNTTEAEVKGAPNMI